MKTKYKLLFSVLFGFASYVLFTSPAFAQTYTAVTEGPDEHIFMGGCGDGGSFPGPTCAGHTGSESRTIPKNHVIVGLAVGSDDHGGAIAVSYGDFIKTGPDRGKVMVQGKTETYCGDYGQGSIRGKLNSMQESISTPMDPQPNTPQSNWSSNGPLDYFITGWGWFSKTTSGGTPAGGSSCGKGSDTSPQKECVFVLFQEYDPVTLQLIGPDKYLDVSGNEIGNCWSRGYTSTGMMRLRISAPPGKFIIGINHFGISLDGSLTGFSGYRRKIVDPGSAALTADLKAFVPGDATYGTPSNGPLLDLPSGSNVHFSWTSNSFSCDLKDVTSTTPLINATGQPANNTDYNMGAVTGPVTFTVRLTCTGGGGTVTDDVTVTVKGPPVAPNPVDVDMYLKVLKPDGSLDHEELIGGSSTSNPNQTGSLHTTTLASGTKVKISWSSTNATSCDNSLDPNDHSVIGTSPEYTLSATASYTLKCTNALPSTSYDNFTVNINTAPQPNVTADLYVVLLDSSGNPTGVTKAVGNSQSTGEYSVSIPNQTKYKIAWSTTNANVCNLVMGTTGSPINVTVLDKIDASTSNDANTGQYSQVFTYTGPQSLSQLLYCYNNNSNVTDSFSLDIGAPPGLGADFSMTCGLTNEYPYFILPLSTGRFDFNVTVNSINGFSGQVQVDSAFDKPGPINLGSPLTLNVPVNGSASGVRSINPNASVSGTYTFTFTGSANVNGTTVSHTCSKTYTLARPVVGIEPLKKVYADQQFSYVLTVDCDKLPTNAQVTVQNVRQTTMTGVSFYFDSNPGVTSTTLGCGQSKLLYGKASPGTTPISTPNNPNVPNYQPVYFDSLWQSPTNDFSNNSIIGSSQLAVYLYPTLTASVTPTSVSNGGMVTANFKASNVFNDSCYFYFVDNITNPYKGGIPTSVMSVSGYTTSPMKDYPDNTGQSSLQYGYYMQCWDNITGPVNSNVAYFSVLPNNAVNGSIKVKFAVDGVVPTDSSGSERVLSGVSFCFDRQNPSTMAITPGSMFFCGNSNSYSFVASNVTDHFKIRYISGTPSGTGYNPSVSYANVSPSSFVALKDGQDTIFIINFSSGTQGYNAFCNVDYKANVDTVTGGTFPVFVGLANTGSTAFLGQVAVSMPTPPAGFSMVSSSAAVPSNNTYTIKVDPSAAPQKDTILTIQFDSSGQPTKTCTVKATVYRISFLVNNGVTPIKLVGGMQTLIPVSLQCTYFSGTIKNVAVPNIGLNGVTAAWSSGLVTETFTCPVDPNDTVVKWLTITTQTNPSPNNYIASNADPNLVVNQKLFTAAGDLSDVSNNSFGTRTSNQVGLAVFKAPILTLTPSTQNIPAGSTATFTMSATNVNYGASYYCRLNAPAGSNTEIWPQTIPGEKKIGDFGPYSFSKTINVSTTIILQCYDALGNKAWSTQVDANTSSTPGGLSMICSYDSSYNTSNNSLTVDYGQPSVNTFARIDSSAMTGPPARQFRYGYANLPSGATSSNAYPPGVLATASSSALPFWGQVNTASLTPGTYSLTAIAVEEGNSANTASCNLTLKVSSGPPGAGSVAATGQCISGNGAVTITWSPVSGATGYNVYRNTSSSFPGATLVATTSATSINDPSPPSVDTWYYVKSLYNGIESIGSTRSSLQAKVPTSCSTTNTYDYLFNVNSLSTCNTTPPSTDYNYSYKTQSEPGVSYLKAYSAVDGTGDYVLGGTAGWTPVQFSSGVNYGPNSPASTVLTSSTFTLTPGKYRFVLVRLDASQNEIGLATSATGILVDTGSNCNGIPNISQSNKQIYQVNSFTPETISFCGSGAGLKQVLSAAGGQLYVGDKITYKIQICNTGSGDVNAAAKSIWVSDRFVNMVLDSGSSFTCSGGCNSSQINNVTDGSGNVVGFDANFTSGTLPKLSGSNPGVWTIQFTAKVVAPTNNELKFQNRGCISLGNDGTCVSGILATPPGEDPSHARFTTKYFPYSDSARPPIKNEK